jgi:hypothetical protein
VSGILELVASRDVSVNDVYLSFVEDEHTVLPKTLIPSRKATRQYFGEEFDDHEDGR